MLDLVVPCVLSCWAGIRRGSISSSDRTSPVEHALLELQSRKSDKNHPRVVSSHGYKQPPSSMKPKSEASGPKKESSDLIRTLSFRPRARLVSVLGEHLISDQAVGLIEIVKNAYDADATEVGIEILGLSNPDTTTVIIRDNGTGMTIQDIEEKWLSPAVNHKERAKQEQLRTSLGRLPIGEKGVGRFAVHQMGRSLELITRSMGSSEILLPINWDEFETGERYLDAVDMKVREREPQVFTGENTGTFIKIRRARCQWTRALLEKVHRTLRRLQSPLRQDENANFKISLTCPDYPEFENLDSTDVLERAHYEFRALIDDMGRCDFEYKCNHPGVEPRAKSDSADLLPLAGKEMHGPKPACGEFWINLYVWDRTKDFLSLSRISAKELDAQCGVSLFRDHLRVLPYGEPGNDWLLLDQERIQDPSGRIGNNQVIGLIEVLQSNNLQLRDTTNREGLIENAAFQDLKALTRAAIRFFTTYWKKDRPPARQPASRHVGSIDIARKVATAVKETASDELQVQVPTTAANGDDDAVSTEVNEESTTVSQRRALEILIENLEGVATTDREREKRLERLLTLAATGLAAERVVHEFGRQVAAANEALNQLRRFAPSGSRSLEAVNLLDNCLTTLRSEFRILAPYEAMDRLPKPTPIGVREAVELALTINRRSLDEHGIQSAVLGDDFQIRTRQAWVVQVIDNIVNNACHWLAADSGNQGKALHIILDRNEHQVLILDNGPGIHEEAKTHLFEPFFSMKAGGTGLGLYISKEVMRQLSGDIRLLTASDSRVDPRFAAGAAFVLDFQRAPSRRSK
jgi:C4-dicarboxylate-specific signal transduction histidine kinase